jgi:hypothetical protein
MADVPPERPLDVTNLPRFLDHLASRDEQATEFARLLLDDEWAVSSFWGPEQMDVWELVLRRGGWFVQFRIERGFSEGVRVARADGDLPLLDDYRSLGLAVFAWARAHRVPFRLGSPDDVNHDLVAHGRAALDWLREGHGGTLDRVSAAWYRYRLVRAGLEGEALVLARAAGVAAMEDAAAS